MKYDFQAIEKKWQARWEEEKPFAAITGDPRPKFYGLIEFPYPSGAGLHVGHARPYTAMDVIARKHRMQGENVLFPMGYDAFAQAAGEESYQMPASTKHDSPYTILTSDKLVSPSSNYYRSYTKGGKTGSLDDWQNFAGWHTQDGETYVSVVLHSPKTDEDPRPALTETAELMDWAFATFTVTAALDTTQPITELPIVYSSQTDTVMIYPADDMQTLLPRQGGAELTEKTFNVPEHLSAPIKQGDVVGTVTVTMQGETVGTVDLLAGSSVDRNELLYTMAKVKAFFSSTYFKVVIVLCIIAAVVYAVLWVYIMLLTVRRVEQPTPKRKNKPND